MSSIQKSLFLFSLLLFSFFFGGCRVVGEFYTRPRPASFYSQHYCFDITHKEARKAVLWFVKRYRYPIQKEDKAKGTLNTKPVVMSRYSRNPNFAYEVGLDFQIKEHRGKLSLKHLPPWVFSKKLPPLPKQPQREKFPNEDAFDQAQERYMQALINRNKKLTEGVSLMRTWRGCDIRKAELRTIIQVKASLTRYPYAAFGKLNRKKAKKIRSNLSLEYSILRVLGHRLKRLRFMPRLLH